MIKEAEVDMLFASGSGLGAIILGVVAIAFIWRIKDTSAFAQGIGALSAKALSKKKQ